MYNPSNSLPGKRAKVSISSNPSKPGGTKPKPAAVNPLGITVDTTVSGNGRQPPEQVYPPKPDVKDQTAGSLKKKTAPPKPLDLRACYANGSSKALPDQPSSCHEAKTPIIIITPTHDSEDQNLKSIPVPPVPPVRRPRLASSIYTLASPVSRYGTLRRTWRRASSSAANAHGKQTPPSANGHSFKDRDAAQRASLNNTALPTPNRSSGWWTHITSPFLNSAIASSQNSLDSDPDSDETPLRESAAPMGVSRSVDDGSNPESTGAGLENSPFRNYIPPASGLAAAYYDPSLDFKTPELQSAGFQTPEIPMSARTVESDIGPIGLNDREIPTVLSRSQSPEVRDSAKKVPMPEMPCNPPPKSSRAAVVEDFSAHPGPAITPKIVTTTLSRQGPLSPLSPSPILETASMGTVQMARSIDSESTRSPAQKPVLRVITGNKEAPPAANQAPPAFGILAMDNNHTAPVYQPPQQHNLERGLVASGPPSPKPAPKEMLFYHDQAQREAHEEPASRSFQGLAVQQSKMAPGRHAYTASVESNQPLMFYQDAEKLEAQGSVTNRPTPSPGKQRQCSTMEKLVLIGVGIALTILSLVIVLLCMFLPRQISSIPVAQQWLNLTGYPPIPTGISTVAQMDTSASSSGCVSPPEMWSCALPKQQRLSNNNGQPRFRFLILFNNKTISDKTLTQTSLSRRASLILGTKSLVRRSLRLQRRGVPGSMLYPYPWPPTEQDQTFLGNTTDSVAQPYAGEETPFVITFMPTTSPTLMNLTKRTHDAKAYYDSHLLDKIPSPTVRENGAAEAPILHPFPKAQPLRLFDRGRDTEHYGFYTYFDKSIFLSSNGTSQTNGDGGARISESDARCTWSQTRFLVKIWTRRGSPSIPSSPDIGAKKLHVLGGVNGTVSAFDFSGSGSFPLPITISEDRHGGDSSKKGLYCYGVDTDGNIITQLKTLHQEDRAYDGTLLNPAPGPFADADISGNASEWGGIDGGTGGCSCEWNNFNAS